MATRVIRRRILVAMGCARASEVCEIEGAGDTLIVMGEEVYQVAPEEVGPAPERPHTRRLYAKSARQLMACPECGYDLRGSTMVICPECGLRLNRALLERARGERPSHFREVYQEPVMALVAGMGVSVIVGLATAGPAEVALMLVGFAIAIVIGWLAFFGASIAWIGIDQPPVMSMVQLAGAFAASVGTSYLVGLIPIPVAAVLLGYLLPLFVLVGCLARLLELELVDAFGVALLAWLAISLVLTVLGLLGG